MTDRSSTFITFPGLDEKRLTDLRVPSNLKESDYSKPTKAPSLPNDPPSNKDKISSGPVEKNSVDWTRMWDEINQPSIEVLSLDVFDTALLRPFLWPTDLFHFLTRFAREITGLANLDFAVQRINAEKRVRKLRQQKRNHGDPTIEEIYQELAAKVPLSNEWQLQLMQLEEESETKLCYGNPIILEISRLAVNAGKRVVFCSDTYLSEERVRLMLANAGYESVENIVTSASAGATKRQGRLYSILCRRMGVEGTQIIHIGDNETVDVKKARSAGLNVRHLCSPRDKFMGQDSRHNSVWPDFTSLQQPMRSFVALAANRLCSTSTSNTEPQSLFMDRPEDFGYYALGPFLYTLVMWIRNQARRCSIDRLLFLSRDGYLPLQAWRLLKLSEQGGPEADYLRISRRAVIPLLLERGNPSALLGAIPVAKDYKVCELLRTRFGAEMAERLLKLWEEQTGSTTQKVHRAWERLNNFLVTNQDIINKGIREDAINARAYYKKAFDNCRRPGLFDVGSKGTFQNILSNLMHRDIHGFYILTEGPLGDNLLASQFDCLFGPIDRSLFPQDPDTVLFEALLSEPGPSVIGFCADGSVQTEADEITNPHAKALKQIHKGALSFVRDVSLLFGDALDRFKIDPRQSINVMSRFWQLRPDNEILRDILHEDNLSQKCPKQLNSYYASEASFAESTIETGIPQVAPYGTKVGLFCPAMSSIRGGAERVTAYIAHHLESRGYRIVIYTRGNVLNTNPQPVYELPQHTKLRHLDPYAVDKSRQVLIQDQIQALVVLASGLYVTLFPLIALGLRIPVMLSERAFPGASKEVYWAPKRRWLYNITYSIANRTSVQFPSFIKAFPLYVRWKTCAIPNPVFPHSTNGKRTRGKVIVCIARVSLFQKRQDLLLKAFALAVQDFKDWTLELYGFGPPEDMQQVNELIQSLGISDQVKNHGPTHNVAQVLDSSSIFVLPSKFEGFPNALSEALAAGLPAVGFRSCPGVADLIEHERTGLLVDRYGDVNALASCLKRLMSSETLRSTLGKQAALSMSQYAPERCLAEWHHQIDALARMRYHPLSTAGPVTAPVLRLLYRLMKVTHDKIYM